jgi:ribose-phosphate pyrophosphokinase
VPISARLLADLLQTAGYTRMLAIDLHANQIQGFFNIPVDNLMALPIFISHFKSMNLSNVVVVSPDAGGVERARAFSQKLGAGLAIADKRRQEANVAEIMHIIGEVEGKTCIIVDDIIDTAGTLTETIKALKKYGAQKIYAACTHGIFSGKAMERINEAPIEKIFTTDTVPLLGDKKSCSKIEVLSVGRLFADAIDSIHKETSVSTLFV